MVDKKQLSRVAVMMIPLALVLSQVKITPYISFFCILVLLLIYNLTILINVLAVMNRCAPVLYKSMMNILPILNIIEFSLIHEYTHKDFIYLSLLVIYHIVFGVLVFTGSLTTLFGGI